MFNVDTVLAIFKLMVKLLNDAERKQTDLADSYQASIDKLSAAKKEAVTEAKRAREAAAKVSALLV